MDIKTCLAGLCLAVRLPSRCIEGIERMLPPIQYDHDYDGELTIHRTLDRKCIGCAATP